MKKSLKGALLSGLVFPGAGQIALNQKARGIIMICIIIACFCVIIAKGTQIALAILQKFEAEGGVIDIQTISVASSSAVAASDSYVMQGGILLIIFCWIFGIIDAYRIGNKMDQQEK